MSDASDGLRPAPAHMPALLNPETEIDVPGVADFAEVEVARFQADVVKNPQVASAVFACGTDLRSVVGLANAMGYEFDFESFDRVLKTRTRAVLDDVELTGYSAKPGPDHPEPSDTSTSVHTWATNFTRVMTAVAIAVIAIGPLEN